MNLAIGDYFKNAGRDSLLSSVVEVLKKFRNMHSLAAGMMYTACTVYCVV